MMTDWPGWGAALEKAFDGEVPGALRSAWFVKDTFDSVTEGADPGSPGGEAPVWGAWRTGELGPLDEPAPGSASAGQDRGDVWFGVEADAYEDGLPAEGAAAVVCLAVRLPLDAGKHREPARERVLAAMAALRGARRALTPYLFPASGLGELGNRSTPPAVLVLNPQPGDDTYDVDLGQAVWLCFPLARARDLRPDGDALGLAIARWGEHSRWMAAAVHEARGALAGWGSALSRDVVTGWAGEVAARASLAPLELEYGPWRAPYDLRGGGQTVEVKATVATSGGQAHWSAAEIEVAQEQRGAYRLVLVRVEAKIVDRVFQALADTQPTGTPNVPPATKDFDVWRLYSALEADGWRVWAALSTVQEAIEQLREPKRPITWRDDPAAELPGNVRGLPIMEIVVAFPSP
jgi:hypothetical protein